MSNKKNLLNEAQVRQFMKLASLQPLTPGFVGGLSEDKPFTAKKEKPGEDLRKGAEVRGAEGTEGKEGEGDAYVDVKKEGKDEDLEEVHGRGANEYHKAGQHRGGGVKLDEEGMVYRDDPEAELGATEDELGAEDHVADEEGAEIDDLEGEVDAEADAGAEASLTVAQVVDAIESALQDLLPNEEVEAEYVGDDEEVEDVDPEAEFAPEGDEVVADVEVDEELEEALGFGKDYEKMAKGEKGSYAPDPEQGEKEWKGSAPGPTRSRRSRRRASDIASAGGMKIGGITAEGQDELVEQITKRVAARILKAALSKK